MMSLILSQLLCDAFFNISCNDCSELSFQIMTNLYNNCEKYAMKPMCLAFLSQHLTIEDFVARSMYPRQG